ncbi:SRPBCC family protein [Pontibacter sp. JH31]|uniref:SRPBCC family protein n=1 Tax=Pontibacter aquaedesilientis TaxID=2766980 RepID=A0ABR7XC86_9BACT|nr:SRPBCC family protein [Pontibacter aquaedesilientis]MBD1395918.1 SRPBCC family protein [Pontibacter aquaedesilientis]
MNPLKSLILGAITLVAILAIISISLPRHIYIQRDILIQAPAEAAYEQISDIRNWPNWLPGHHHEPARAVMQASQPHGIGTKHSWVSQRSGIKPGVVTIVSAEPHKRLVTNLEFEGEEKAHSTFTLLETAEGTLLTWHFEKYMGDHPLRKFSGLLLDSTLGEEFEDGLENIKREVESQRLLTEN